MSGLASECCRGVGRRKALSICGEVFRCRSVNRVSVCQEQRLIGSSGIHEPAIALSAIVDLTITERKYNSIVRSHDCEFAVYIRRSLR